MNWFVKDMTYAVRFLRKRWGVTTVAVLVMALGISLTGTMYAIIDGVVLSGPDYPEIERMAFMQTTIPQSEFNQSVRVHDYLDWKEQQTAFSDFAAYTSISLNLSGDDARAENFTGARLSASTFDLLQTMPFMGRAFTPEEDFVAESDVVILGYHVWVNRFDKDPAILGKTIRLNAKPTTVVGIMPEGFRFPEIHDMWVPLGIELASLERREGPGLAVIGRLNDNATLTEARSQLTMIASRIEAQFPDTNEDVVPVVESFMEAVVTDEETTGLLYTMLIAVIGVLLIACANVANLLFGLTIARGKELAIRTAMGAARWRVLRQLLNETLLLTFAGAGIGLVLSKFSLDYFTRIVAPLGIPPWMTFELSGKVLIFVGLITLASAVISGLLPALHATRGDVNSILTDQTRGTSGRNVSRWSTALVSLEVALSCALLVASGLMVRSTIEVGKADFGLESRNVLTARIGLPGETYPDSVAVVAFSDRLLTELDALPGATKAAITSNVPVLGTSYRYYGVLDHDYANDGEYSFSGYTRVTPTFFDVIDVPIVAGRGFDNTDILESQRVVIVDERFAELNWPGEDVIGKQVRMGRSESENPWLTVVGVVSTFEMSEPLNFGGRAIENLYIPFAQGPSSGLSMMVKTAGDPLGAAGALRDLMFRLDSDIPISNIATFDKRIADGALDLIIIGGMFMIFGVVALILASIGLYAVMAFSVTRRTSEVGVRLALGASGGSIIKMIVRQGSKPLVAGLVVGLLLALLLGNAIGTFLFNVEPLDPFVYTGIPVLLTIVSLAALLIPARRAARTSPVVALRED